jgi:hypothetical protein
MGHEFNRQNDPHRRSFVCPRSSELRHHASHAPLLKVRHDVCFMWKIAVIFVICLASVAMSGQKQTPARERQRETQQPPPAITVTTNESSSNDKQRSADKPQGWHKFVTWPEGIVTWAIILTLGAIVWQAIETRRAASAANKSAEATLRSVKLQETQLRQWLSIEDRELKCTPILAGTVEATLWLSCQIVNPTKMALTLKEITTKLFDDAPESSALDYCLPMIAIQSGLRFISPVNLSGDIRLISLSFR